MTNETVVAIMMLSSIVVAIILIKDVNFDVKSKNKKHKKSC